VGQTGPGWPRGANHVTESNHLYEAPADNFPGPNPSWSTREESSNGMLCYWRRRWTSPQQVCVDWAATTGASPHALADPSCDPTIGADFGIATIGYPKSPALSGGCGVGMECALAIALLRWRRRAHGA
jgi:hypothetical protein